MAEIEAMKRADQDMKQEIKELQNAFARHTHEKEHQDVQLADHIERISENHSNLNILTFSKLDNKEF